MTENFNSLPPALEEDLKKTIEAILNSKSAIEKKKVLLSGLQRYFTPNIKTWYTSQIEENNIKKSPVKKFVEQVLKMDCESKPHCYIVVKEEKPVSVSKVEELEAENTELAMTILEYETQIEALNLHIFNTDVILQENVKLKAEIEVYKSLIDKLGIEVYKSLIREPKITSS